MESLNMSKLNLTSATSSTSNDESKPENVVKHQPITLSEPDNDFQFKYREDIWKNLLEQEAVKPTIHLQSPQLEFRGTLVQLLRDVTKQLSLSMATLHTAVAQLDLFMDAHRLRADRLTHIALACLSLAAKSEEQYRKAPSLRTLSITCGLQLCGKTFRQLEWMVGQHVSWRLLSPTPVTFAALLAQYVVTEADLKSRHPKFVRRFKKDGARLLDAYLDLTLYDVRLKVVDSVDVGCACVACARADLGLAAWPAWLVAVAGRKPSTVQPLARLLQRMMQTLKSRDTVVAVPDADSAYVSAKTLPDTATSDSSGWKPTPSSAASYLSVDDSCRQHSKEQSHTASLVSDRRDPHTALVGKPTYSDSVADDREAYSVLDLGDSNPLPTVDVEGYYQLPTAVDVACHRVNNAADYRYCMSSRLLEASLDTGHPPTSVAVKRGLDTNVGLDMKRYRMAPQVSQTVQ